MNSPSKSHIEKSLIGLDRETLVANQCHRFLHLLIFLTAKLQAYDLSGSS